MGAGHSALADLRAIEDSSKRLSKRNRKDGLPVFENGAWQDAIHRFLAATPLWVEVGCTPGTLSTANHGSRTCRSLTVHCAAER